MGILASFVAIIMAACTSQVPQIAGTSSSPLTIVAYTVSVDSTGKPNNQVSVSASCKPGEQMLGGGFVAINVFEYAAFISENYPASVNTWTVSGSSISHFVLAAEVYCLQHHAPLGIQIAGQEGQGNVTCPAGSVLLSGGGRTTDQSLAVSQPEHNGWQVVGQAAAAYALCATQHVTAGSVVSAALTVQSSTNGDQPGTASASCSHGQITVGGGFSGGGLTLQSAASSFTGWTVTAGGDFTQTISAVCLSIQ